MELMKLLVRNGMLLQSAHGPIPNVAELVAGETIEGSWWGHPRSHTIFDALGDLDDSPDVVRLRLVNGKITLVHRRVWPALVRVAEYFSAKQLAALHEEHTASGAHSVDERPFASWVTIDILDEAAKLTIDDAWARLPACLQPSP